MPEPQKLYHADLYPFQAEGVAQCYLKPTSLVVWDTGTGKTHLSMATAALLFEDDLIDLVLVICEKNKLDEWVDDFGKFTDLGAKKYHGSRRKRLLDDLPQVLVTTYETSRNDAVRLVEVEGRKSKKMTPGPLLEGLTGLRVLIAYDEMTKLGGSRTSQNHKAHAFMLKELRANAPSGESGQWGIRAMGLTATPLERSPENLYNLGRILDPEAMGTVANFESTYIKQWNIFGQPSRFKNLTPDEMENPNATPFVEKFQHIILRKRKTDPDVIDQFPSTVEEVDYVELSKKHYDFYDAIIDIFDDGTDQTERVMFTLLRQIAGHPASLVHSQGQMAKAIVGEVGEAGLRDIGSAKLDRLVEYLEPLVKGQGAQAVVFTYFGPSMIPLIQEALHDAGISTALNHGQMSDGDRKKDKAAFKAGEKSVFLTSDAGARGINLPEALYVIEYEMALQHAMRVQRVNRIHRIDSKHPSVTFQTFIAKDTVEDGPITNLVSKRNKWSDDLIDFDVGEEEDTFTSAEQRKELMKRARKRVAA